ncbi:MAG: hypothetical protein L0Z62_17035 [Gemmataceae bacterium]|nr:hypothetical protein [Gemmataceae bacterium]
MKQALALLVIPLAWLSPASLRANEPPESQLDFVRKLREKGYADLALEYLETLRKTTPSLAGQIPMEMARARTSLARQKPPAQRAALFAEARKDLEAFIQKNPNSPDAAQARAEVARLASYQGQALLSQASREEAKAAADLKRRAEDYFIQAGKELQAAGQALTKPEDKLQLQFDLGKNLLDQAQARPLDRKRAELIGSAQKVLEAVEKVAIENNRNPTLHLCRAWLVKCYQEGDEPTKAALYVKAILREVVGEALPGQRLAWYFKIAFIPRDITVKGDGLAKLRLVRTEAQAWLKAFPGARNSPEGCAVRFEMAKAYIAEAEGISKDPRSVKAAPLYNAAQKELAALAGGDNDFTERAAERNLAITFRRMSEKGILSELTTFDDCYLRARFEMWRFQQAKTDKERREHLRQAIAAFQRGLQLGERQATFQKQAEARYYMTYLYLLSGDPYRAAILGEDLAHANTRRSPAAAGYALQAYGDIVAMTKQPGDRARLRELARFILEDNRAAWADEPVSNVARYQLAVMSLGEKDYARAFSLLDQITPNYSGYVYAQAHLAVAAADAWRNSKDPKERQAFQERAFATLKRLPPLPEDTDALTARMYLAAQVEKGGMLSGQGFDQISNRELDQASKTYSDLSAFHAQVAQQYAAHGKRFSDDDQERFAVALTRLRNVARFGLAQSEYRAGRYDNVLAPRAAGDGLAEVRKLAKGNDPIKVRDHRLVGETLGLAMRANVQKGNIPEAKAILGLVRRLSAGDEADPNQARGVLQTLVLELKTQVRDLKNRGDAKQLEQTVKNFSQFLDVLAKEAGGTSSRENLLFLGSCYASLDKHAEAAKLYAQVSEPKVDPKKKQFTDAEEKELQDYWLMQVNRGRALRLAKELPEAKKVLERVVHDPLGRGKFLAEKELIHLLEDQGLFGKGITSWSQFMAHPQMKAVLQSLPGKPADEQDRIKTLYFECYYHYTWCHLMYGKNHSIPAKQTDFIKRAADKIVKLEQNPDAWRLVGDDFRRLLRQEPMLLRAYLELGGREKDLK